MCLEYVINGINWFLSQVMGLLLWTWSRGVSFAAPVLDKLNAPVNISFGVYTLLVTAAIVLGFLIGRPNRRDRKLLKEARQAADFQEKNAGR